MNTGIDELEQIRILRLATEELRRMYDHISNTYDQLRIKAVALIAGEVALLAFVFSNSRLSLPTGYYGQVTFLAGAIYLIGSFVILFWTISAMDWLIPPDLLNSTEIFNRYPSEKSFLEYLHNEYLTCLNHNLPRVNKRARTFNWTLYLLAASGIVLIVIIFGGNKT